MTEGLRNLFLQNIFTLYGAQLALLLVAGAFCLPALRKFFAGFGRGTWILLALLAGLNLAVILILNKDFAGISEEWEELFLARLLSKGELQVFYSEFRHGFSWPALVSFVSRWGNVVAAASTLTLAASALTAVAVYLSALLLFSSTAAAAAGGLLFTFSFQAVNHAAVFKGKPMVAMLAAAGFIFTTALVARLKSLPAMLFAAAYLAFIVNIRQEFMVYPLLLAGGLFLLVPPREYGELFDPRKIFPAWAAFAVLSLGFYFISFERGLGAHGLTAAAAPLYQPAAQGALESFSAQAASAFTNFIFAGKWWLSNPGYLALLLIPLAGIKRFGRRRPLAFLYGSFLALNVMYIALAVRSGFPLEYRLLDQIFPFLALIGGFAAAAVLELKDVRPWRRWLALALLAGLVAAGVYPMASAALKISCPHSGRAEVEQAAALLRGGVAGKITVLVGSRDQEAMWRCLTEFKAVNIQRIYPYKDILTRPDTENAGKYPLPFELLPPPVMLVRQDTTGEMEGFYYQAIARQCRLAPAGRLPSFALYSVAGCKPFNPEGNPEFLPEKMKLVRLLAGR
ncbi:MAG: hypothetical protein A2234_00685 [Elusimicrobia bacterium RIFOXYA2_FULL_58_8]|nr:MAG: hypothetical protein A2234_00685 [Elusimicrobia bacterium RIFOXYA2_FULL_58_8]